MSYDESNSAVAVPAAATVAAVGLEEGFALDADVDDDDDGGGTTEPISSDGEGPTSPRLFFEGSCWWW